MNTFKGLLLALSLLYISACASVAPTPVLMGQMDDLNTEVLTLYIECSEAANYVPEIAGCDAELLDIKVTKLLELSEEFIKADFKQPQGYDIHLATSMIFFRIAERTANDYTRAEQISRQFFEVQKATGGRSLDEARFYWPWFAGANSSYQYYNDRYALNIDRKADLLLALGEGTDLSGRIQGVRLVRLHQALRILEFIVGYIDGSVE